MPGVFLARWVFRGAKICETAARETDIVAGVRGTAGRAYFGGGKGLVWRGEIRK
jgi:hypothetical protein